MPRNSARSRSSSSSGVMSCRVTTTDSVSPSSERMGVALTRVVTLRPSGAWRTISSARTVSPVLSAWASGNSSRETSRPSARRKVSASRSCSADPPGAHRSLTIRLASRLIDVRPPVFASNTRTPTGVVFTRVSRSALARCSSRCRRALAMTSAAWEANITRVSSSSCLNSRPGSLFATWMLPTLSPRWRMGAAMKELTGAGGANSGSPIHLACSAKSRTRSGPGRPLRYSKNLSPSGISHSRWASPGVRPETQ